MTRSAVGLLGLLALVLVRVGAAPVAAQPILPEYRALDSTLRGRLGPDRLPGLVVGVFAGGQTRFLRAYGIRTAERGDSMPVDALFRIASTPPGGWPASWWRSSPRSRPSRSRARSSGW